MVLVMLLAVSIDLAFAEKLRCAEISETSSSVMSTLASSSAPDWIVPQGGDPKSPQAVDTLKLVSPKGSIIKKGLDGLFQVDGGGTLPSDPDATLTARSLEGSNVNASATLVDMIDASRSWEAQVKMLTTVQDMDKSSAALMQISE